MSANDFARFCEKRKVRIEVLGAAKAPHSDRTWPNNGYRVRLSYRRRRIETDFYQGLGVREEPTAPPVLYSLLSDARAGEMSFSEFCSDFGYDEDSRKVEAIWKSCVEMAKLMKRFLREDREAFEKASEDF